MALIILTMNEKTNFHWNRWMENDRHRLQTTASINHLIPHKVTSHWNWENHWTPRTKQTLSAYRAILLTIPRPTEIQRNTTTFRWKQRTANRITQLCNLILTCLWKTKTSCWIQSSTTTIKRSRKRRLSQRPRQISNKGYWKNWLMAFLTSCSRRMLTKKYGNKFTSSVYKRWTAWEWPIPTRRRLLHFQNAVPQDRRVGIPTICLYLSPASCLFFHRFMSLIVVVVVSIRFLPSFVLILFICYPLLCWGGNHFFLHSPVTSTLLASNRIR